MANHKSAKKRAKQSEIRRGRNMIVKTKMKNAIKALTTATEETVGAAMINVQSIIAKSAKKGAIHNCS